MESTVLFVLAIVLYCPNDVGSRHHTEFTDGSDPPRDHRTPRGPSLADITPESQNNTEVVAQVGGTASIKCYTHFIHDQMVPVVTWLKRDSDQLLTAGGQVYSSEARYSVSHVRHQQLWELSVRGVMKSDGGVYECQLTTYPPTSLFFTLNVVEARAVLQGGPDMHIQTGATLRLHCVLHHATEKPEFIFWYHNGSMINYAPRRPLKVLNHHYSSALVIADVRWDDAGKYICEPHNAQSANLTLHVVAGEKQAALHNGDNHSSSTSSTTTTTTAFVTWACLVLVLLQHLHGTVWAEGEYNVGSPHHKKKRDNDNTEEEEEEAEEEEDEDEEEEEEEQEEEENYKTIINNHLQQRQWNNDDKWTEEENAEENKEADNKTIIHNHLQPRTWNNEERERGIIMMVEEVKKDNWVCS